MLNTRSGDALLQAVGDTDSRFEQSLDVARERASRLWVRSRRFAVTYDQATASNPSVSFFVLAADGTVVEGPLKPHRAVERACELAAASEG